MAFRHHPTTARVSAAAAGSPPFMLILENSTYQSQKVSRTKACSPSAASPKRYSSSDVRVWRATAASSATIQASMAFAGWAGRGVAASKQRLKAAKRAAFHSLLAKSRAGRTASADMRMSCPWPQSVTMVMRVASVPYWAMRSSGSMTLPFVFDIFWPAASRTSPCM